ncbi:gamma-interferon-inducible lysosomal thiol reductase-like isoform X1 [Haliotis rubra]|uniref:gamma-interferon-inducible lysosomal thiol reductase-like isoform X1 n=2 Tax=Haliotis rubra TaxID=36100 RepID=UPI001EE615E7|nr:gamma-interferon-inducible lysosomal thiol reductase-like isoform X1 [Haliotis rubra]
MMGCRGIVALLVCIVGLAAAAPCLDCVEDTTSAEPVDLVLYYESMCPYCRKFITTQLYPAFTALPSSVLNLTIVPYGNARERQQNGSWEFACQHGPVECLGNLIAACALNYTSYQAEDYMPFINCMELSTTHGQELSALHKCAAANNVSEDDVLTCMKNKDGGNLMHEMALETEAAKVHYVPWIVVNGQHTTSIQNSAYKELMGFLCKTYTGPQPTACKDLPKPQVVG